MNYSDRLKDPRWQKKRLKTLERDNFACLECGDDKNQLHVHHMRYEYGKMPWQYSDKELVTLCSECHTKAHKKYELIKELSEILKLTTWEEFTDIFAPIYFEYYGKLINNSIAQYKLDNSDYEKAYKDVLNG